MDTDRLTEQQKPIRVLCDVVVVGDCAADSLVNDAAIAELKATRAVDDVHQAQLHNHLKATGLGVGLMLSFGTTRLGIKRMVRRSALSVWIGDYLWLK
jgi:GxxExxY protein